jgi:hypothetical protein
MVVKFADVGSKLFGIAMSMFYGHLTDRAQIALLLRAVADELDPPVNGNIGSNYSIPPTAPPSLTK